MINIQLNEMFELFVTLQITIGGEQTKLACIYTDTRNELQQVQVIG